MNIEISLDWLENIMNEESTKVSALQVEMSTEPTFSRMIEIDRTLAQSSGKLSVVLDILKLQKSKL